MRKVLLFGICWLIGCISCLFASDVEDSIQQNLKNTTKIYIVGDLEVSNLQLLSSSNEIQIIRIHSPEEKVDVEKTKKKREKPEPKPLAKSTTQTKKNKIPQFKIAKSPAADAEFRIFSNGKAKAIQQNFPTASKNVIAQFGNFKFPAYCLIVERKNFKFEFFSMNWEQSLGKANRPRPSPISFLI